MPGKGSSFKGTGGGAGKDDKVHGFYLKKVSKSALMMMMDDAHTVCIVQYCGQRTLKNCLHTHCRLGVDGYGEDHKETGHTFLVWI